MCLSDLNHYLHNFHTICEVDILFRSNMRRLADFDMNLTSNKHKNNTHEFHEMVMIYSVLNRAYVQI